MRICYIAPTEAIHTLRWLKYFVDKGHEVHLISFRAFRGNNIEGVRLHLLRRFCPQARRVPVLFSGVTLLSNTIRVRNLIRRINPDILHAHYIADYGFRGALSGFHPLVLSVWGSDVLFDAKRNRVLRTLTNYALKKADLITCDAKHMKEKLIELGIKDEKIKLIYHGVETQKFNLKQKDGKLLEKLGISNSPMITSTRNLRPVYDIESLIKAMPQVLKQVPEAKFVIVGEGEQKDYLEKLASCLGVSGSVRFVGWISSDALPIYLTSADIYVSTSLSDAGLAASTAEAMACGLPVIITDFGDNRKWVQDGVNGYIIPLRSPEVLASRIVYLIRNKDIREKFGQINRQIIEEKNNWEKEMGKMGKLYEELIERCNK